MCTFVFMVRKLRKESSGFVRIGNKAIKIAKANKKKTGTPIGKFIEELVYDSVKKEPVMPLFMPNGMKEGENFTFDKETGTITIINS